jgi:hypothetical protein
MLELPQKGGITDEANLLQIKLRDLLLGTKISELKVGIDLVV